MYLNPLLMHEGQPVQGQSAPVLWFTGLSGAGKSTLSLAVAAELRKLKYSTIILDGDIVRKGLCSDLGFSPEDRSENIRRVGEVAKLFTSTGVITLAAFITPYQKDRDFLKSLIGAGNYLEIYCNCSVNVCESRDVKGHYKNARTGDLKNFTGIDSAYERPLNPDLIVATGIESVEESLNKVLQFLRDKNFLIGA